MATQAERLAVVETKVDNIEGKVVELKDDVKEVHDCLDNTREGIMEQLRSMHQASCDQHNELAGKISSLEKDKSKFQLYAMACLAFAAGAGWIGHIDASKLLKFVGL